MKPIILLAVLCVFIAGPVLAEEQHQHRRPDDIKQYLEHLDSTERIAIRNPPR